MSSRELAKKLVEIEMARQDEKWGPNRVHPDLYWLGILVEEVGEVAEICIGDEGNLVAEVTHVAAVATQWLQAKITVQGLLGHQ